MAAPTGTCKEVGTEFLLSKGKIDQVKIQEAINAPNASIYIEPITTVID